MPPLPAANQRIAGGDNQELKKHREDPRVLRRRGGEDPAVLKELLSEVK
jgi:hypothetical protein